LRWPISNRTTRRDHAVRSTDHQLELVMAAAALLDSSKRVTLVERIAANLMAHRVAEFLRFGPCDATARAVLPTPAPKPHYGP
jgi:hypothetical protein